jgi:putative ABC transport system substrate-binding protein
MRRREFIKLLGSTAVTWPLTARAQQPGRRPIVGFLGTDQSAWSAWTAAFVQRLRELGWIEDHTVSIKYRWAEGRPERVAEIAAEFVRLKVDVIVSYGTAVPELQKTTSTTLIVFPISMDPVSAGLVLSLARPGGNVTGLSIEQPDATGKRLELLREVVPRFHRLAIMVNVANSQTAPETGEAQAAARALGLEVAPLEIRRADDIGPAFEALKSQADALYIVQDTLTVANRMQIITFALGAHLPTIVSASDLVRAGALMSYGPKYTALFRRAAEYVDMILRGRKPGDIPVEQPTKFDLVINLTTAKAIGLTIPQSLLARADEVIE